MVASSAPSPLAGKSASSATPRCTQRAAAAAGTPATGSHGAPTAAAAAVGGAAGAAGMGACLIPGAAGGGRQRMTSLQTTREQMQSVEL